MNPIADTVGFLTQPQWPVYVFWLLLLGSLGLSGREHTQPRLRGAGRALKWLR